MSKNTLRRTLAQMLKFNVKCAKAYIQIKLTALHDERLTVTQCMPN